ncbi:MAG TPA: carboxylating nicotinate-nucleotide diphosphorylase [Pseudomonadales bacterium]|nr:carboxylating nicotinate-nucleotide diphosphorylase [Pseudomonadales bacterium]HND27153.1 carboxylating nicotinate-nucleotide diphosphorylase [Pseudomonadales bacterium]HNH19987.1 carboxylating nicotinate-nucleotide diphosphorylase [Pseudomonadales bacterium]HNI65618.1 carboxylating nicotinate-nucleotide diphosphorylase [Pseudomonadales bacterium]
MPYRSLPPMTEITANVTAALNEDIGSGDLTAQLIPATRQAEATLLCRDAAVVCGRPWVDRCFELLDPTIRIEWLVEEGAEVAPDTLLARLHGPARALLTGERTALNFLQTLSATATRSRQFADLVRDYPVQLLDTRKTLPGLRLAQKYAVRCGGCHNHRLGLYDAFLIKENHIASLGSITAVITQARGIAPNRKVEIEVESLAQLQEAIDAGADIVMLDNFSLEQMHQAVQLTAGRLKLEASGGMTAEQLRAVAATGVDYISLGTLTKDIKAIDLSMRFTL